jgi:predicted nucleic acid-binding protein
MGTLIDTSLLVAAERGTLDLEGLLSSLPREDWFLPAVSVSEMLHGVLHSVSPAQRVGRRAFAEDKIRRFRVLPFDVPAARAHAEIRTALVRRGTMIGERDLLIGATAISRNCAVATRDLRSFPRIPNLIVRNF